MHKRISLVGGGLGLACALLIAALLPGPARAVPAVPAVPIARYVTTTGSGVACTSEQPCSLHTALGQSTDGDTIFVASGVYTGTGNAVVELHASVALYGGWSAEPGPTPAAQVVHWGEYFPTVLDGEDQRQVVYMTGNISPTLAGFVITHGQASEGGGIFISAGAAGVVRDNLIVDNHATGGWSGGIQVESAHGLVIEHNRILSNSTPYEGGGVSASFNSELTLKDNLIAGNSAGVNGGGIRLRDVQANLINNTIADNFGAAGDGLYVSNATITLTNNVIAGNLYGLRTDGTLTPTIAYNDVWGNTAGNYSGLPDPTGTNGNISLDPLFVSGTYGGYYLSQMAAGQAQNSPALDAGSDTAVALDLDWRTTRNDPQDDLDRGLVDLGYHAQILRRILLPLVIWP